MIGGSFKSVEQIKKWYYCPECGQKLLKYDDKEGKSRKVYIKCKKCRKEVEIKIN